MFSTQSKQQFSRPVTVPNFHVQWALASPVELASFVTIARYAQQVSVAKVLNIYTLKASLGT